MGSFGVQERGRLQVCIAVQIFPNQTIRTGYDADVGTASLRLGVHRVLQCPS